MFLWQLKCFQYDWWYQSCLGLSFMLCTSFPFSPDLLSCDFTIVKCARESGEESLHRNLPWKSMWQKGDCEKLKCKWHPTLEQELQSLLLTLQLLLWPAAYCWDSWASPGILYAHHVKKWFIAEWEWAVQMGNHLPFVSLGKGEREK